MAAFKCKMCGGNIELEPGATVGVCDSCGTKQTLPKNGDDVVANLFNRANNLRLKCEFDKAEQVYEKIVQQDDSEAEAHWGIVLCKYGIEYVDDPATGKKIPTCHRTLFDAVTADPDYIAAVDYSDTYQQTIYESEARAIDRIQKDILAIAKNEKPFDVFICYKETDENGKRTVDSAVANDIYYQLTQEGFKVFYAAITLEDKLGQEYEPYIFAALNSAKVMLVIGTKPEYFNAVWVKNEWSRYLKLMKSDRSKLLIPCFRDMDAYDLPEEFAHLQAQDMSKIGFINDVVRGIKKVAEGDAPKAPAAEPAAASPAPGADVAPLLKRAFMFLEDGNWSEADAYCERVLDQDPENADAYLGKLMAEQRVKKQEDLKNCAEPFDKSNNYQKAIRFASPALADELKGCVSHIKERNENSRLTGIYNNAKNAMNAANTERAFKAAADKFATIPGFKDADALAEKCLDKAEVCRLTGIYNNANNAMNAANTERAFKAAADTFATIPGFKDADTLAGQCLEKAEICRKDAVYAAASSKMTGEKTHAYEAAIETFKTIPGWKDADEQIKACETKIEEIKADRLEAERKAEERRIAAEKEAKKRKKEFAIGTPIVCACIAFLIVLTTVIIPNSKYNAAISLMKDEKYDEAITAFEALNGYKDSADKIEDCIGIPIYEKGTAFMEEKKWDEAIYQFNNIQSYKDSKTKLAECQSAKNEADYNAALALAKAGKYQEALEAFTALENYKDSAQQAATLRNEHLELAKVGDIITFGHYEQDNNTANGKEAIEWQVLEVKDGKAFVISKYGLDCQEYNSSYTSVTWEKCSLRTWLNGTFLKKAFSADEQAKIATTTVSADKEFSWSANPGNATTDKVFLLSITEAEKYFTTYESRKCAPTAFAEAQGAWAWTGDRYKTASGEATCRWWLRSPGDDQYSAVDVDPDGPFFSRGNNVDAPHDCVRPALWINLD